MGFFSKIWKGLKKGVKSIGKGIKSAFKKFGKFMNKIGILGQVAMFFILPGIGQALGSMWTGIAGQTAAQGAAATAGATAAAGVSTAASGLMAGGVVSQAAGSAMRFVSSAVSKVGTVFSNVTQGITETLGNFAKTASNNLFGTSFDAAANFFGPGDSAWSRSFGESSRISNLTQSEGFFDARDAARESNFKISQTEKALNTSKGQQALEKTVSEQGSDFLNVPELPDLRKGLEGVDITGGAPLVESAYQPLTAEQIKSFGTGMSDDMLSDYKFNIEGVAGDKKFTFGDRVRFISEENLTKLGQIDDIDYFKNFQTPVVEAESLLSRLKTGIKGIPDRASAKIGEIADDPLGYVGKGMEKRFQSGVQTRLMQEAGIIEKPEYVQNYVSNNAYVPSFESFGGSQQQYGAPEIMNARSFEQQVTNNPNPYGYTAFQYGNYMSQYSQTS